jgi:hypothetical protein
MYFPETYDTTPNDCVGREQEIIDFVEQHFVIDDIDRIRFQNETYHIKQFLSIINSHTSQASYGLLTGLSNPFKPGTHGAVYGTVSLNGEFVSREILYSSVGDRYRSTQYSYLFTPNVGNPFMKHLFQNEFDIYVMKHDVPCSSTSYQSRISYIEKLSEKSDCEPKPKNLNYIQIRTYPRCDNGQSYGELIFTKETLIPVCKYLIAINLYHNSFRYYAFKNKVETGKLLKEQQLLIGKEELHDSIIVSLDETLQTISKFLDHNNMRILDIEQHQTEILHNQNVIIDSIKLKKDKRLKKMRDLKL